MWNHAMAMSLNPSSKVFYQTICLRTRGCMEFHDCTELIQTLVQQSGIQDGLIHIQSKHTTASVLVNENEPLLLQDMKRVLEKIAPQSDSYLHNDFSIRTVNMNDREDRNGHSHCKALFLPVSQMINIVDGQIDLGRWQRIFLLELDREKERMISVVILGV
jgi:secondary thiamine-phosphate synthase enzyme